MASSRFIESNVCSAQWFGRKVQTAARWTPPVEFSTPAAECQFVLNEAIRSSRIHDRGQSQGVYSTGRRKS
jgi:hypothetical protein